MRFTGADGQIDAVQDFFTFDLNDQSFISSIIYLIPSRLIAAIKGRVFGFNIPPARVFHVLIIIKENQFVASFFTGDFFIEIFFGAFGCLFKPLVV